MARKGERWLRERHEFETNEDPYLTDAAPAG
ncbi:MAG TPA: ATPase, partial [Thermosulfurimonas dismutans]|nr:ATPase [Thermosulfurimonas dismutans]